MARWQSVEHLSRRLASAQRVAVVGNGGIALEIVHAVRSCEVSKHHLHDDARMRRQARSASRLRKVRVSPPYGSALMACMMLGGLSWWLQVLWVVKDEYIGNTFFDASASSFILPELRCLPACPAPAAAVGGLPHASFSPHARPLSVLEQEGP